MAFEVDPRTLLNKLAFGPSDAELHGIAKTGTDGWLAQQLRPPAEDDCAARIASTHIHLKYSSKTPEAEVDEDRSLAVLSEPIEQHWKVVEKSLAGQERNFFRTAVVCATTIRAVHSRWQLREVLADFWHNHFNVSAVADNLIAVALPTYDSDVIRRHALGNFRELLEAVAKSAAMQIYLNNRSPQAARPTRIMRASCSSFIRSAGRPTSMRSTIAGAMFPVRSTAARRAISTRMSTRPRVLSPAGRSRMAPASAPGAACRRPASSSMSRTGTTITRSVFWPPSSTPTSRRWPMAVACSI